ncbi:hypothetical protein Talka_01091 [Tepidimonas alkaliphilus]|uniref:Lipoprotein n=1 Tax=Tepidimonas alkaliphilus TaxID=2588942 RepID=A0A554W9F1_9BURK|nr:hypothetical protein [Tepidimonas alkaliphilus]TSE20196.1 hypothetical protein Talka_01091 [Tepidimonas alkaliphilus]
MSFNAAFSTDPPAHPVLCRAWRRAWLIPALLLALVGCAAPPPTDPDAAAQAAVRQRAQARADAIVRGDAAAAYALAVPSYRQLVTPEAYATRLQAVPVQWLQARVHEVQCPPEPGQPEPQRCTVRLELTSQPRLPLPRGLRQPLTGFVEQIWVREQGQWWMLEEL